MNKWKNFLSKNSGFTVIELIVIITIIAVLLGVITLNLTSIQQKVSISTTAETVIADIKGQQIKAMIGDTQGISSASDYSVHFDEDEYVLFRGSSYSALSSTNFVVKLPANLKFQIPATDIIFSKISGELPLQTSIILKDITNSSQKTININKYGVVTGVN